jgi:exoribonuclease R
VVQLPRILSERLCSLNSGQDSLAFSAIFELSRSGEVVSQWFGKSIIRNCMQMSYELAQSIIDGVAKDEDFKIDPHVAHLHSIEKVREGMKSCCFAKACFFLFVYFFLFFSDHQSEQTRSRASQDSL